MQIAIIIDDIGAKASDAVAFSLPKDVTFSILPHTEFSTRFSYFAAEQNREVMLHMPMESLNGENLGEGAILANMYPSEVEGAIVDALQTVPHAVGMNNHMGSKLTQMTLQMKSVMTVLQAANLFFIDSRTTRFTKASLLAEQFGVKAARRHIFLDHYQTTHFLQKQFQALIFEARKRGKAIGIAHPYPVTLTFLNENLAKLPEDIELVTVSKFLREKNKFRLNPRLASASRNFDSGAPQSLSLPN
ncbi:divergent polysaccharide deacetylase family protein [Agaribacter flavus]|uniref:Divergent polysaccharide deacetylase family protein n=1 Tax=Agaribacter flavus TaxID=1902781 RepID=A0ABV7FSM3_9ALTE